MCCQTFVNSPSKDFSLSFASKNTNLTLLLTKQKGEKCSRLSIYLLRAPSSLLPLFKILEGHHAEKYAVVCVLRLLQFPFDSNEPIHATPLFTTSTVTMTNERSNRSRFSRALTGWGSSPLLGLLLVAIALTPWTPPISRRPKVPSLALIADFCARRKYWRAGVGSKKKFPYCQ